MKKKKNIFLIILIACYALAIAGALLILDGRHARIDLVGEQDITIEYGSEYNEPGASVCLTGRLFGTDTEGAPQLYTSGHVDTDRLGRYIIRYYATYLTRETAVERTVTVADTTPPVITLNFKDNYELKYGEQYVEEGYTATDACDGDLTSGVIRTETEEGYLYTVSDSSGNTTSVERHLHYALPTPEIILNGDADQTIYANFVYQDPGFTATDAAGNDLSALVKVESTVVPYISGQYTITYTIPDYDGKDYTATRNVNVIPVEVDGPSYPSVPTIYLTFDDGPSCYTDTLLDVLDYYGVKATFFVTSGDPDYTYCIGRAFREGHSIGVHACNHDYYTIYASEENFLNDFLSLEEIIYSQTGQYSKIFRFPGGSSNTVSSFNPGIMSRLARGMTDMGYRYFDWNVDSDDAGSATNRKKVIENVENECWMYMMNNSCVVLQHDIKDYSVAAVESIIIWGKENGFRFAALDVTSFGAHHSISN